MSGSSIKSKLMDLPSSNFKSMFCGMQGSCDTVSHFLEARLVVTVNFLRFPSSTCSKFRPTKYGAKIISVCSGKLFVELSSLQASSNRVKEAAPVTSKEAKSVSTTEFNAFLAIKEHAAQIVSAG